MRAAGSGASEGSCGWCSRQPGTRARSTPHRRFSLARRRISATSSSGIGVRPGGLGWRHFVAASRRCQCSCVPGVTIRCAQRSWQDAGECRGHRCPAMLRNHRFVRQCTESQNRVPHGLGSAGEDRRGASQVRNFRADDSTRPRPAWRQPARDARAVLASGLLTGDCVALTFWLAPRPRLRKFRIGRSTCQPQEAIA